MPNGESRGKNSSGGGGKGGGKGKSNHGGGKGGGVAASGGPVWDCHICGLPSNYGWRLRCRGCDAIRRNKGIGGGSVPAASDANRGGQQQSLAERQLRQLRDEQRKQRQADDEEKRQLKEALARLQKESSSRKTRGSGEEDGEGDEDGDDGEPPTDAYSSWTEEERQKKLEEARGGLAYFIGKYGEESAEASATREEISAIQRASRDAKPFKAHRSMLERKRERLLEKQKRDESEVAKITAELDELESKRKDLRGAIEERGRQIATVEEELAELVKRALAEGDAAGAAGRSEEDGSAPWSAQAATAALQSMAARPGVPPEFAALLAHVVQAAQAITRAATPTTPTTETNSTDHRDGQQQQRQQQQQTHQQGQPHQPGSAANSSTSQGTGAGRTAAGTGGKGGLSGATTTTLAPQGRWNKTTGGNVGNNGARDDGDDMQIDATGPNGGPAPVGDSGNPEEDEQELLEEGPLAVHIDEGVAESIGKLPVADQEKLKAALGARGGRRRPTEEEKENGAGGSRDRERSPRPTKGGQGQQEQ